MNAKPCYCKPIRCGQMWVFLCSMIVCMLLLWFFLRRLLFFLCFSGKCIVAAELCDADAGGGGPLNVKKCGGTCPHRLQIQGAECQYLTNMTYIAEIRLHFQTNYVALRLWDVFLHYSIPMFAQVCTCTVLFFQFISSLIDFCNSSIARQTSVSSKETLIASFQTCQSNPQVFKLANACYILLQLTTSVVAGKIQYISIMQWPCAKPFLVARHDYSKRTSTAFAWKAQPSIATGGSWWKSPPDRQIRKLRKLPQSTNFPWSKFMYIW